MKYALIVYLIIGIIECICDWHKELKQDYKNLIEAGEKPDSASLVVYWFSVIALWPVLVICKAYRWWK